MKIKFLDSYVIIILIIIALSVATYIVPAGTFDREINVETGMNYVVPDSFQYVDRSPVSVFQMIKSIPEGMNDASDIIMFVLMIGGSIGIINGTGTFNVIIANLAKNYSGKEKRILIFVMIMFSLGGATFGMSEETLPLYPLMIALAISLGYNKMIGLSIIMIGVNAGFTAGFMNPFNTGIAQQMVGLPLFSGMGFRLFAYCVFMGTGILFLNSKLENNRLDPSEIQENMMLKASNVQLSKKNKHVVAVIIISLTVMIYGILKLDFYITEIATMFLIMGVASGMAYGHKSGRIVTEFTKGASNLVYGALIIGLARAIMVVMQNGGILDTIIYSFSSLIHGVAPAVSASAMFIVQSILDIFISSSTGQAAVTLPIMMNVGDLSELPRQITVLAFQFGDGFTNMISPTVGMTMAALALGGVSWKKWIKFILPLFCMWYIEGIILLTVAVIINYGPF